MLFSPKDDRDDDDGHDEDHAVVDERHVLGRDEAHRAAVAIAAL